jgi:dual specificity phosphatase 12
VLKFPVKVDMHTFNVAVQEGMVESKLQCVKCEARLGNFNWAGMQCSCGTWVNPAFQLHKSRVDAAPL